MSKICFTEGNERRKGLKGRKGLEGQEGFRDRIAAAFERERGDRTFPRRPLECDTTYAHVFRCVCCGRKRREEDRREPNSEVCIQCVEEAGFLN